MSIAECGINCQRKQWIESKSLQANRINCTNDYPKYLLSPWFLALQYFLISSCKHSLSSSLDNISKPDFCSYNVFTWPRFCSLCYLHSKCSLYKHLLLFLKTLRTVVTIFPSFPSISKKSLTHQETGTVTFDIAQYK